MNNKVYKIVHLLVFLLFVLSPILLAQPGDPPGGDGGGDPVGGTGVPIDGGILSILLAGGVLFSLFGKKKVGEEEEKK